MNQDSTCKFCGEPIRWVDDDGRRLALDLAPITEGGSYRVAGAGSALRVKKAQRATFGKLYRPHNETCSKWEDAKAFLAREKKDREERATIKKQIAHERETLPENVVMLRNRPRGQR